MSLSNYYKKAVFYPSIIVFVATIVFSIIDNYNYKSEWLTAGSIISLSIITAFIYCVVFSLLSLTIFLNRFHKVKENAMLNFLSWFLFPLVFMSEVFVHEITFDIKYEGQLDKDFAYVIILNLPFLFGLIWSYIQYRKQQNSAVTTDTQ